MTDGPIKPVPTKPAPHAGRPTIKNADVPSESALQGLPDVGEGASGSHFVRGTAQLPEDGGDEGDGKADALVPVNPPNPADPINRGN